MVVQVLVHLLKLKIITRETHGLNVSENPLGVDGWDILAKEIISHNHSLRILRYISLWVTLFLEV